MNRLSRAERATIIRALVEGNSIRSVSRMTGAARNTISALLVDLGKAVSTYQDRTTLRPARRASAMSSASSQSIDVGFSPPVKTQARAHQDFVGLERWLLSRELNLSA